MVWCLDVVLGGVGYWKWGKSRAEGESNSGDTEGVQRGTPALPARDVKLDSLCSALLSSARCWDAINSACSVCVFGLDVP